MSSDVMDMDTELTGSEIAIIGMSCRFPGANTLEEFWNNLHDGVESISQLSDAELLTAGVAPEDLRNPNYVKAAPLLDNVEHFDAGFFGYTAIEAEIMDPQQRLLLECAWEALEHAGYNPETYPRSIGVYAGAKTNTYLFHLASRRELLQSMDFFQLVLGGDLAMLSTRLSYKFDLKGPSYAVQTACSTSLVAVHLACQSLLIDECQMALAGAVAINVPHKTGYQYQEGGILSPDGHCRAFDARAQGTIFGSGAGMVVLKRLEDALADGDTIYAVIKGTATNNDGSIKATFTAPSVDGQTAVILESIASSGVDPETISYVETHGTGTQLGDPIEIEALTQAFRASTERNQFCAIGSVKSNVGHLDAAAGMSSLIKTILSLQHRQIPPSLHFEEPNPKIDFANSPFFVNTQLTAWQASDGPRRAGVSSFGFGGTNAHVIIEEAAAQIPSAAAQGWQVLTLSAKTPTALDQATERLARYLTMQPASNLADVAYTLQIGRKSFEHRRFVVCRDHAEALAALTGHEPERLVTGTPSGNDRPVVFMFSGQGAQYVGMGRELYASESVFRQWVDRCCALLQPYLGLDLRTLIYAESGDGGLLEQTQYAQPALFAVEYALAQLWLSWGVTPQAMLGHSIGEYVAATLAGVFSLEDALALVAARGRLMQQLPAGSMLSVSLPEAELVPLLGPDIALAAINTPKQCVVSGAIPAISALQQQLEAQGVGCRLLHTSHAFHSAMMEPILEDFAGLVRARRRSAPTIPYISNLTGTWITDAEATDPHYWAQHLRQAVRFAAGIEELRRSTARVFLEVGPGTTLSTFVRHQPGEPAVISSMRHPNDQRSDEAIIRTAMGQLWVVGGTVDWATLHAPASRRRIPLPTYPFERQRYWIDIQADPAAPRRRSIALEKRANIDDWFYLPTWQRQALPPTKATTDPGGWLIFCDAYGVGDRLAQQLTTQGHVVIRVQQGAGFSRLGEHEYALDPRTQTDYTALLEDLQQRGVTVGSMIHLWSIAPAAPLSEAQLDLAQTIGFYSLLYLGQALGRQDRSDPLRLSVISSNAQYVTGNEPLCPEQTTILGPCKVLPKEYPFITCRSIDIAVPAGLFTQQEALSEQLLAECLAGEDSAIVYRDGERWVQHYQPIDLAERPQTEISLRTGGVYLITGGLGGIGLVLADELARSAQAKLVLTGRTALPPRESWAAWLAERLADDATSAKIRQVLALEEHGAEVLVVQADVTDRQQMQIAIETAIERFGAISGVIHAAGIAGGGVIQLKTPALAAQVLATKLHGTYILSQLFADQQLDFFIICSSLQTVLGDYGQVDYCAANAFCDSFALQRATQHGQPYISIGWDNWQEVGIAVHTAVPDHMQAWRAELLEKAISSQEGVEIFRRILAAPMPHVIVSTQELAARIELSREFNSATVFAELTPALAAAAPTRTVLSGTNAASRAEIEQQLTEVWRQVLEVPQVGLHDNFFDLGGTSLSAIQLIGQIKRQLDIQIAPVTLFEAPTISALARLLVPDLKQPERASRGPEPVATGLSDVAIVGMAIRVPGADSVEAFWRNLRDGVESITFFSDEDMIAAGIPPELLDDPTYVKARPILNDVDAFDAGLFGYTPREAEILDPQLRLFMELAWTALEDSGYAPDSYDGAIGVYGGSSMSTYLLGLYSQPELVRSIDPVQAVISNDKDALTTSVSYKLNLRGPSMAVQTFCSTSLVAVHLACQSLLRGECSMAIAGGVSIVVPQQSGYHYQEDSIVSRDGHCRAFSDQAQGTLFGNGVGAVVLKPLSAALADGDTIHAVIKGSAINNDGSHKVGYTAPSVDGQAEVIKMALQAASVASDSISYVEAHGTGTALGDPIEITALTKAFRTDTNRNQFCAIGSVKTNIGHLDRAAGVAALVKTVLALKHRQIPPSLHYESPNPRIDFANSPFYVNAALTDWKSADAPRRAGISSLGFGGTNAHVILEEAPAIAPSDPARPWQLLVLSAQTRSALETATANLGAYLSDHPDCNLADVAYTLQLGRKTLNHRRFVVCQDQADACETLAKLPPGRVFDSVQETDTLPVIFMFSGQGAQYVGMGRELYASESVFRQWIDRCAEVLRPHLQLDLRTLLYDDDPDSTLLEQTQVAQPALFAVEYALAQLWLSWGVQPHALIGHSIGEYVAATLAGVFSLEDALALVAARGRLMQQLPAGSMLAVPLPEADVLALLDDTMDLALDLAAVNGPAHCVVAGPSEDIASLEALLRARGVQARQLHTSHAFHSAMIEPMLDAFAAQVAQVKRQAAQIPVISNVSGGWLTAEEAVDPRYWAQHARSTVRFAAGLQTVTEHTRPVLLEVGPGRTLSALAQQQLAPAAARSLLASLPHPRDVINDRAMFLTTLGRLWLAGYQIAWANAAAPQRRQRIGLPSYPFERQRYWLTPQTQTHASVPSVPQGKRANITDWFYLPSWKLSPLRYQELAAAQPDERWLVLGDERGMGDALMQRLSQRETIVIPVRCGSRYERRDDGYTLNPQQPLDFDTLVSELAAIDRLPNRIVYLWSISPAEAAADGSVSLSAALDREFYGLLWLIQAIGRHAPTGSLQLTVVADQTHSVMTDEPAQPHKAPLLGLCKIIPQEYLTVQCRHIDISMPRGRRQAAQLADQLYAEVCSEVSDEVVAYRGQQRLTQTFEPLPITAKQATAVALRDHGVYVITGGLAEIGKALAEYTAQTAHARLVLIEESAFPSVEEWEQWLATHSQHDGISLKIRELRHLEELGAGVQIMHANLLDKEQMRNILQQVQVTYGALHGIVYAAGVVGERAFRAIQELDRAECEAHFAAKLHGLQVLDQALHGIELDFCLVNSSVSCFLGGRGYAAYAASNHFVDAFIRRHNTGDDVPWIGVNWDAWQLDKMATISQSLGQFAMTIEEGGEVFRRILSTKPADQVVISTGDLLTRMRDGAKAIDMLRQDGQRLSMAQLGTLHPRPALPVPYVAPNNELERAIAEVWQQTLGFEQIGTLDNFFDLGGDSLIAIQVVARMKEALRQDVSVVSLYEQLTIKNLAQLFEQEAQAASADPFEKRDQRTSRRNQLRQSTLSRKRSQRYSGAEDAEFSEELYD